MAGRHGRGSHSTWQWDKMQKLDEVVLETWKQRCGASFTHPTIEWDKSWMSALTEPWGSHLSADPRQAFPWLVPPHRPAQRSCSYCISWGQTYSVCNSCMPKDQKVCWGSYTDFANFTLFKQFQNLKNAQWDFFKGINCVIFVPTNS